MTAQTTKTAPTRTNQAPGSGSEPAAPWIRKICQRGWIRTNGGTEKASIQATTNAEPMNWKTFEGPQLPKCPRAWAANPPAMSDREGAPA